MNWAIQRWRAFLWSRQFTVITNYCTLQWIESYDSDNAAVRRIQFEMLGYNFTAVYRLRHLN